MATYVDVEDGLLHGIPADPAHVASLPGLRVSSLLSRALRPD
jgi:hypothetical protein